MVDNRDTCRPRNIFQRNKMEVTSVPPHTRRPPSVASVQCWTGEHPLGSCARGRKVPAEARASLSSRGTVGDALPPGDLLRRTVAACRGALHDGISSW